MLIGLGILILGAVLVTINNKSGSETVKIGAILPLTGNNIDQGEWVKQGLELAQEQINKNQEKKIEVIIEDSQGDTIKAISAYRRIREKFNIPAVITWGSGIGVALTPIVNGDKVVQFGVATATADYSTPDDFTFRDFPTSAEEAKFTANFILNRLKQQRVAVLKINNDYGSSVSKLFTDEFKKTGGIVTFEDSFAPNISDFRPHLTKLQNDSADLVYMATYPKEGALLLKQAKEIGIERSFLAAGAILGGETFFGTAGNAAEGLMVITSAPNFSQTNNLVVQNFVQAYIDKYGKNPGPQQLYSARAYDALNIIALAQKQCTQTSNTECLKNNIAKVKDYNGVSGNISFDLNGDITTQFNVQTVKDNQFYEYK